MFARLVVLGLPFAIATGSGCASFDFEVSESTDEVVLTGNLELFRANQSVPADVIPYTDFTFELDQEPAGIYLHDARLQLTNTVPSGASMAIPFSFVRHLVLELTPTRAGSTLPTVTLATLDWPQEGHAIPMIVDDGVNLLPYVQEGFRLVPTIDGRVPAANLSFRLDMTIGVDVF